MYVVFDNEYFTSSFMITPSAETFQSGVDHILKESIDEIH